MNNLKRDSSSSPLLDWKFSQVFGEQVPGEDSQDIDIISAIEFDKSGDHIAVGDRGGRVVIFETTDANNTPYKPQPRKVLEQMDFTAEEHPEYKYKTEFQSHEPEFDYLKSVEIEEKINKLRWITAPNGSLFILSTNDKTIKMWKVKERIVKKVKEMDRNAVVYSENALLAETSYCNGNHSPAVANGYRLEWKGNSAKTTSVPKEVHKNIAEVEEAASARCLKLYAHAHDYNINSISTNSDGETYLSADDLRINLWNLEISNQCFNIIDMKPDNMEDLKEVITSAEFHPSHCNMLAYSSSRGFIRLVDMRESALCDRSTRLLQDGESRGFKSFFTEIIASISDIKFSFDGRHILSRDYMNLKLWDMNMDASPVAVYNIHEHLRPKFSELYNNDAIFDKFGCCLSGDGFHFATGSYSNRLRIFSYGSGTEEGITINTSQRPDRDGDQDVYSIVNVCGVGKSLHQTASRPRRSSLSNLTRGFYRHGHENASLGDNDVVCNLNSKMQHMAWHPKTNLIACGAGNGMFLYYA